MNNFKLYLLLSSPINSHIKRKVPITTNVFSPFSTYNENLTVKEHYQQSLTFEIVKYYNGTKNPIFKHMVNGQRLRLECLDANDHKYTDFVITKVTPKINKNNVSLSITAEDSFSFDLTKQAVGLTYENEYPENIADMANNILSQSHNKNWKIDPNLCRKFYPDFPKDRETFDAIETVCSIKLSNSNLYNALIEVAKLFDAMIEPVYDDSDTASSGTIYFTNKENVMKRYRLHPSVNINSFNFDSDFKNYVNMLYVFGGTDAEGATLSMLPSMPSYVAEFFEIYKIRDTLPDPCYYQYNKCVYNNNNNNGMVLNLWGIEGWTQPSFDKLLNAFGINVRNYDVKRNGEDQYYLEIQNYTDATDLTSTSQLTIERIVDSTASNTIYIPVTYKFTINNGDTFYRFQFNKILHYVTNQYDDGTWELSNIDYSSNWPEDGRFYFNDNSTLTSGDKYNILKDQIIPHGGPAQYSLRSIDGSIPSLNMIDDSSIINLPQILKEKFTYNIQFIDKDNNPNSTYSYSFGSTSYGNNINIPIQSNCIMAGSNPEEKIIKLTLNTNFSRSYGKEQYSLKIYRNNIQIKNITVYVTDTKWVYDGPVDDNKLWENYEINNFLILPSVMRNDPLFASRIDAISDETNLNHIKNITNYFQILATYVGSGSDFLTDFSYLVERNIMSETTKNELEEYLYKKLRNVNLELNYLIKQKLSLEYNVNQNIALEQDIIAQYAAEYSINANAVLDNNDNNKIINFSYNNASTTNSVIGGPLSTIEASEDYSNVTEINDNKNSTHISLLSQLLSNVWSYNNIRSTLIIKGENYYKDLYNDIVNKQNIKFNEYKNLQRERALLLLEQEYINSNSQQVDNTIVQNRINYLLTNGRITNEDIGKYTQFELLYKGIGPNNNKSIDLAVIEQKMKSLEYYIGFPIYHKYNEVFETTTYVRKPVTLQQEYEVTATESNDNVTWVKGYYYSYLEALNCLFRCSTSYNNIITNSGWTEDNLPKRIEELQSKQTQLWNEIYEQYGDFLYEGQYTDSSQITSDGLFRAALKQFQTISKPSYNYNCTMIDYDKILDAPTEIKLADRILVYNDEYFIKDDKTTLILITQDYLQAGDTIKFDIEGTSTLYCMVKEKIGENTYRLTNNSNSSIGLDAYNLEAYKITISDRGTILPIPVSIEFIEYDTKQDPMELQITSIQKSLRESNIKLTVSKLDVADNIIYKLLSGVK